MRSSTYLTVVERWR